MVGWSLLVDFLGCSTLLDDWLEPHPRWLQEISEQIVCRGAAGVPPRVAGEKGTFLAFGFLAILARLLGSACPQNTVGD